MTNLDGKYSVITFATNQLNYALFALNCARSVLLHNDLPVYIVSNLDFPIPEKLQDKVFIIPAKPEQAALGIGIKLYTDEYLQTEHTLFIDSDCICYGDLGEIFNACEGMDVSVVGRMASTENWCGETIAKSIKESYGLNEIIRFNGGLYYFRNSGLTRTIFEKAREVARDHDYGFDRVKNKFINEEPSLSIAMVLNNQCPIPDNGYFMTDLFTDQRPLKINVLTGARKLRNRPPTDKKYRSWYPDRYSPIILHFGGSNFNSYPYKSQNLLIKLRDKHVPELIASVFVNIFVHVPYKSFHGIMRFLRWTRKGIKI